MIDASSFAGSNCEAHTQPDEKADYYIPSSAPSHNIASNYIITNYFCHDVLPYKSANTSGAV